MPLVAPRKSRTPDFCSLPSQRVQKYVSLATLLLTLSYLLKSAYDAPLLPHRSCSCSRLPDMSTVLAGAPGDCCRKTVQHTGTATGTVEAIAGVETYIARPPNAQDNTKIIFFFADVFGPLYINSKLLMDYWASNGYLVLGLDYFEGDSMILHHGQEGFDFTAWRIPKEKRAAELVPRWIDAVKQQFGGPETKYNAAGFCFGAPYAMDLVATDWFSAGAWAHPAFLNEDHFKNVKRPIMMACAEIDHTFSLEARRRAEDILVEAKAPYFIQVFGQVSHGFALRGDPNIPAQKWAKEECARAILNWFDHHGN
ncbi:Protein AIM2 [Grifola frondosa]|uniref:Protein AIM2 n=1 Tax=Grifola frondosa TaxID=5627 RepID=A0A1C7LWV0_GRIFR|nr:Protein AIM2 [Grifola frondosa]